MKTSDNINEIAAALCKAQASFENPERNRTVKVQTKTGGSYTFDYATFDAIIDMARPHLAANGLSVVQPISIDGDWVVITTRLMHTSGQWIEAALPIKPDSLSPQSVGSAATYGKRYGYVSMLVIASDEDDDANSASGNQITSRVERPQQRPPAPATTNGSGSAEFGKFTDWIKDNIPDLFADRNDAWARVKLAASQQKHNESTLRSCTDPKVFDALKSILSVTDPVAA